MSPAEGADELSDVVSDHGAWRHSLELGHGVRTPGLYDPVADLDVSGVPADLTGRRFLDVGCSDGGHTFACESRGATMHAIDSGETQFNEGRPGFVVAAEALGSSAHYERVDLETFCTGTDVRFDGVLLFNVLYHLKDPLRDLERIRAVLAPGGVLYGRTRFDYFITPRLDSVALFRPRTPRLRFVPGELDGDPTNWFVPNRPGLVALLDGAGFVDASIPARRQDRLYFRAVNPS